MRRRLTLLVIAAILPLVLLAAGLSMLSLRQRQAAMEAEAIQRVQEMSDGIERELFAQIDLLRVLAQTPLLDGPAPDLAGFQDLAVRVQAQLPLWHRIILVDAAGHQVINTRVPYGQRLAEVVDRESHEKVLRTVAPVIGNVSGPGLPGEMPRASFRVPVIRDGEVRFGLVAVVAANRLAALVTPPGLDPRWRPVLIDAAGKIVAAPMSPDLVGQRAGPRAIAARTGGDQGIYPGMTAAGDPLVTAFHQSARTGWSVHLSIPLAIYNQPLRQAIWMLGAAIAGALALTAAFILLLRREADSQRQEAQLRERAIRMEALGRMTGGVAHDFNNILMVILGNLDLLQRRLQAPGLERYMSSIRKAAEKGSHLTRELLAFSRGEVKQAEVYDLNDRVRNVLGMVRQSLRGDIVLDVDLAAEPLPVKIDPIQLDLAILNVTVNARDAMPAGGTLQISTRPAPFPGTSGRHGAVLSISDTGSGIPDAALPHVFEPFFTTKEVGKGTGLGLSQVYGFAQGAGGLADIESAVGRGTTVTIHLPLAEARARSPAAGPGDAHPPRGHGRIRVLLVDDNDEVRSVAAAFLDEAGFAVREAACAAEALDLLEREGTDVLVSDIVMPGEIDGFGLAQEAQRRWPNLPILLVSGYSRSTAAATELGFTLLMKPFEMSELADAVRRAHGGGSPAEVAAAQD